MNQKLHPSEITSDTVLQDTVHHTYQPIYKQSFVQKYILPYGMAFALLGLSVVCFALFNQPILGMACGMAAASGAVMIFLRLRLNHQKILPENLYTVPTFIVSHTGDIVRTNQAASEFLGLYGHRLQDIMHHDGFDEGATFRLLTGTRKNILKQTQIVYIARPLEIQENLFLVSRFVRGQNQNIAPDNTPDKGIDLKSFISEKSNVGFFEKYAGTVSTQRNPDNPLTHINDTLKKWLETDIELRDFLIKHGTPHAQNMAYGVKDGFNEIVFVNTDNESDETNVTFRVMTRTVDNKTEGFVFPITPQNTDSNTPKPHQNINITDDKNDLYTQIFSDSPAAIVITDAQGGIKDHNRSFFRLTHSLNPYEENIFDYFDSSVHDNIRAMMSSGKSSELTLQKGNLKKTIKLTIKKPLSHSETQENYIFYIVDLTEEKSLENKFNQVQKMQAVGQLAGGVAHDFNNLLTAILGHTELLLMRSTAGDTIHGDLMQIQHNANRAGKLVKQLLAFSRQQTLQLKSVSLMDILPDVNELLRRLLGEKITIKTQYGRDLKNIKIDVTQFEQIMLNLAVNARDAMTQGGEFKIITENITAEKSKNIGYDIMPRGDYVGIFVSDTGCGMDASICSKIFEPFFTTKDIGQGTGLGLSTVYGIVKQSKGFIFVESVVGQGTTFKIYFPADGDNIPNIADAPAPSAPVLLDTSSSPENIVLPHTKTILIAEDESSVREFAVRALQMRGYNILEADCGEDALDIFNQHYGKIDLILSDVMMPGIDGPTWVKHAKDKKPTIKVIFMSGYAEDSFRNDPAMQSDGVDAKFLSKPFSLKDLTDIIKNMF